MTPVHHATLGALGFVLGASVGSFLNVCIYRLPRGMSLVRPRSHCPGCGSAISSRDNLPILGWLLLRGRCRRCGQPISARYPAVEALVGVLFLGLYLAEVVLVPCDLIERGAPLVLSLLAIRCLLAAWIVTATFLVLGHEKVPVRFSLLGMLLGLFAGALAPAARVEAPAGSFVWEGLRLGLEGALILVALPLLARAARGGIGGRESPGLTEATFVVVVGPLLGWQAVLALLTLGLICRGARTFADRRLAGTSSGGDVDHSNSMILRGPNLAFEPAQDSSRHTAAFEGPVLSSLDPEARREARGEVTLG